MVLASFPVSDWFYRIHSRRNDGERGRKMRLHEKHERLREENEKLHEVVRDWREDYMRLFSHGHIFAGDHCVLCGRTREEVRDLMPSISMLKAQRNRKRRLAWGYWGRGAGIDGAHTRTNPTR